MLSIFFSSDLSEYDPLADPLADADGDESETQQEFSKDGTESEKPSPEIGSENDPAAADTSGVGNSSILKGQTHPSKRKAVISDDFFDDADPTPVKLMKSTDFNSTRETTSKPESDKTKKSALPESCYSTITIDPPKMGEDITIDQNLLLSAPPSPTLDWFSNDPKSTSEDPTPKPKETDADAFDETSDYCLWSQVYGAIMVKPLPEEYEAVNGWSIRVLKKCWPLTKNIVIYNVKQCQLPPGIHWASRPGDTHLKFVFVPLKPKMTPEEAALLQRLQNTLKENPTPSITKKSADALGNHQSAHASDLSKEPTIAPSAVQHISADVSEKLSQPPQTSSAKNTNEQKTEQKSSNVSSVASETETSKPSDEMEPTIQKPTVSDNPPPAPPQLTIPSDKNERMKLLMEKEARFNRFTANKEKRTKLAKLINSRLEGEAKGKARQYLYKTLEEGDHLPEAYQKVTDHIHKMVNADLPANNI